ncbi:MAG: SemiSWEET family transporter [Candidatus Paceibacterota bacterium]
MTVIGGIASVSSIPQVLKIWETGDVSGISLTTQLAALFAVCSWFLYGLYIKNKPLAITSGLSVLVLGTVVIQMFTYQ